MKQNPPPPLTLFDASQFEFESSPDMKAPSRPPATHLRPRGGAAVLAARLVATDANAAKARRRRALARLAKRRYLTDTDGYERMEQTRRALQLVGD